MARETQTSTPESGIGRQDAGPQPGGATQGAFQADTDIGTRQAVEGREDDDLGAGSEAEMLERGMRSTPSMSDVRSDDMGMPNGEPR